MADELDETVERQKTYLEELVKQRARTFRWFIYWAGLCGAIFSVALIYYIAAILKSAGAQAPNADAAVATALDPNIAFGTAPYLVIFLIAALTRLARRRELNTEIHEIRFEVELSEHPITPREVRAERLFRMNQYELRKYYDLNRNQNRLIVGVGIICIFLGLGVVFVTLNLVSDGFAGRKSAEVVRNLDVWIKGIVAFVGAVGTILVNYVAAIFLKMHTEAATALGEFHARLVGTHRLFLANVLASRIDDDTKRQDTLAELAKTISNN